MALGPPGGFGGGGTSGPPSPLSTIIPAEGVSRARQGRPWPEIAPNKVLTLNASSTTEDDRWTRFVADAPTILAPYRGNQLNTLGMIGSMRISAQYDTRRQSGNVGNVAQRSPVSNGILWLSTPGVWWIRLAILEIAGGGGFSGSTNEITYIAVSDPDPTEVSTFLFGRRSTRPTYHSVTTNTTWMEEMTFQQRFAGGCSALSLTVRGADHRYRWGGPPSVPTGLAYDIIQPGQRLDVTGASFPMSSLWIRTDAGTGEINLITYTD